jgi:hypothetical protein
MSVERNLVRDWTPSVVWHDEINIEYIEVMRHRSCKYRCTEIRPL